MLLIFLTYLCPNGYAESSFFFRGFKHKVYIILVVLLMPKWFYWDRHESRKILPSPAYR